ncbi:MAG TPA: DinB family protein [Dactylosporangium sp.]|nr:DinB family protein [Dactylosporangium sp.]
MQVGNETEDGGMATDTPAVSAADSRVRRPPTADERTTLVAFLGWHRETLRVKCAGLTPTQLADRVLSPSGLSLLGLVRHAAETERFWFRTVMAGEPFEGLYAGDGAFDVARADERTADEAWAAWRREVEFGERFVDEARDLDVAGDEPGEGPVSLRWVLMHLLEEYARHNGHADLLRERIDGVVGL